MSVTMVITNERIGTRQAYQFPSLSEAQTYQGQLEAIMKDHGLPSDFLRVEIIE